MDPLIILSLVGLALVCAGAVVVVFLAIARRLGGSAVAFFTSLMNHAGEEDKDEESPYIHLPKPDLRTIASRADFDAAVAKHIVNDEITSERHRPAAPPNPHQTHHSDAQNVYEDYDQNKLRRRVDEGRRRNENRSRDYDDDMLGGMLDLDGEL